MTAKEIREFVDDAFPSSGFDHERLVILGEIAAQLAELNEKLGELNEKIDQGKMR